MAQEASRTDTVGEHTITHIWRRLRAAQRANGKWQVCKILDAWVVINPYGRIVVEATDWKAAFVYAEYRATML